MKFKKTALTAILFFTLITGAVCADAAPAMANSGPKYWQGSAGSGVYITEGKCPVEVEREVLTFDIPLSDGSYYEYGGSVTADYTFFNPTDTFISARLAFPFDGGNDYYDEENKLECNIELNGEKVEAQLRHTFKYGDLNFKEDVKKIRDGFADDAFYTPDLPVYKYTYIAECGKSDSQVRIYIATDKNIKIFYDSSSNIGDQGVCTLYGYMGNNEKIEVEFYSIGGEIESGDVSAEFFYSFMGGERKVEGNIKFSKSAYIGTFKDYVLAFNSDGQISDIDYYNSVLDCINTEYKNSVPTAIYRGFLQYKVLKWYVYDIAIGAGEKITNKVTAPLYPSFDLRYSPNVAIVNYYLSPAGEWAEFGNLEIVLNTEYYVVGSSVEFSQIDGGYSYKCNGLPDGELTISLSTSENPKLSTGFGNCNAVGWGFLAIVAAVLIIAAVVLTVKNLAKWKRQNR